MSLDLDLQQLSFRYTGIGASDRFVLQDVSLRLNTCECTAIVGPSGSGKTTLIQHFTGLLKPVAGRVLVDGQDIWRKRYSQNQLRRRIGLVFQFPEAQLFEETVFRDVAFGPINLGVTGDELQERVVKALQLVGLDAAAFSSRSPFRLSEGEKRRVAIAGVLAMQPEMVVLDEPTAGLDPAGIRCMADILTELLQHNTTPVLITHNMDFVAEVAQRVIVMLNGQLVFDGAPGVLFRNEELLHMARLQVPEFMRAMAPIRAHLPADLQDVISFRELLARSKPEHC
jgi:energy-coupling factor transport system ATP-binding protein